MDYDDATLGRRSCDQLQCTVRDDHGAELWPAGSGDRGDVASRDRGVSDVVTSLNDTYYLIPPQVFLFYISVQLRSASLDWHSWRSQIVSVIFALM